jgi:type I site-specific restriction endonuclease
VEGGVEVKRVLFLADRNILVDQTMFTNDFKPFGGVMTKVKQPHGRQVLRDLPRALPGDHGTEEERRSIASSRPTSST